MSPDGEESLYLLFGQEGCTDGTLTFSPVVWALCSFCCGFYRWAAWAGFAAEHDTKKGTC